MLYGKGNESQSFGDRLGRRTFIFACDNDLLSGGALTNHKTPKKAITLKGRTEFKLSSKFHGRRRKSGLGRNYWK